MGYINWVMGGLECYETRKWETGKWVDTEMDRIENDQHRKWT